MWIQVRSMDGRKTVRVDDLSKLTPIEELRERLVEDFEAPVGRQKLFYRGKLLIDGHKLFDYDVNRNDIIQIMVRPDIPIPESLPTEEEKSEPMEEKELDDVPEAGTSQDSGFDDDNEGSTYKLGDIIDARDEESGAWFEGEIKKITRSKISVDKESSKEDTTEQNSDSKLNSTEPNDKTENDKTSLTTSDNSEKDSSKEESFVLPDFYPEDDGFLYHVVYEGYEEDDPVKLLVKYIRPRARNIKPIDKVQVGDRLLVCHNMDEPRERGYWFDATITHKKTTKSIKDIIATVYIGKDLVPVKDCQIMFWWDIMALEKPGTQLNKNDPDSAAQSPSKRASKPDCEFCKDKPNKKCKECACRKCGGKDGPDKQILCDECEGAYHIWCLNPPLTSLPDDDEWFCPECKNDASEIVQTGEKLKSSKKKAKMASVTGDCKRDWGKGMACVGRTQVCTIVPPTHFGPIPGVEVGTMWRFRMQVSEVGVHRPHVAGIHGREDTGAFSIVLSGGYEDDEDNGDEFTYTGSGGRDLSGNKRTAEQSCDQTLTRMNRALAKNCAASIDNKNGAEAKDWKKGVEVRVVRNCKGRKHSNYAPEEGNRYDGIYKIVKYWPQKGQSGFIVWRYMLRRDDPTPAPWTKEGKKRIIKYNLTEMRYPEGYLEKQESKEAAKENDETPSKGKKGKKRKKVLESDEENEENKDLKPTSAKKSKIHEYKIESNIKKLMKEDKINEKAWEQAKSCTKEGARAFLAKVEELFLCICCQDIAFKPVTTVCSHNICKTCLQRSFKAEVYVCPACRTELGKDHKMAVNEPLTKVLNDFFPGYEVGR